MEGHSKERKKKPAGAAWGSYSSCHHFSQRAAWYGGGGGGKNLKKGGTRVTASVFGLSVSLVLPHRRARGKRGKPREEEGEEGMLVMPMYSAAPPIVTERKGKKLSEGEEGRKN